MFFDKYRVYYGIFPATLICNGVHPGYRHVTGGWDSESIKKREIASAAYIALLNKKNGFYDRLLKSVNEEGFKNPISISAGYCLTIYQKYLWENMLNDDGTPNWEEVLVCDRKGGSRLWAAQRLNIDIPIIISDYVGMFKNSDFKELFNKVDIINLFTHHPSDVFINEDGVNIGEIPHIHLKDPNEKC